MSTEVNFCLDQQRKWVASCYSRSDYYHWLIKFNKKPIGFINICEFDVPNRTSSWGFYIGDEESLGLGALIPPFLYNFLFNQLFVKKINVEVFFNNLSVINLHQFHGYRFIPNKNRIIEKNAREILLVAMSLSCSDWNNNNRRFRHQQRNFPTSKWIAGPGP